MRKVVEDWYLCVRDLGVTENLYVDVTWRVVRIVGFYDICVDNCIIRLVRFISKVFIAHVLY